MTAVCVYMCQFWRVCVCVYVYFVIRVHIKYCYEVNDYSYRSISHILLDESLDTIKLTLRDCYVFEIKMQQKKEKTKIANNNDIITGEMGRGKAVERIFFFFLNFPIKILLFNLNDHLNFRIKNSFRFIE